MTEWFDEDGEPLEPGKTMRVNLIVNGQTFASAMVNDMWRAFLEKNRPRPLDDEEDDPS